MKNERKKTCPNCNEEKSISEFHKKGGDSIHSYCKSCVYEKQKARWLARKKDAVDLMGGKCCMCGYNKNLAALNFHHLDPRVKEFSWGKMRLLSWGAIIEELKKCVLVCSNCHMETHYPQLNNFEKQINGNSLLDNLNHLKSTGECHHDYCKNEVYGTKFCSVKCARKDKRKVERPPLEELLSYVDEVGFVQTGKKYGVSDNAIRKWIKSYKRNL